MGLRAFFATDAGSILETATSQHRRRWNWAKGEGLNWKVEVLYNRETDEIGVRFSALGNTASSLGRPGQTRAVELMVNGHTLTSAAVIDRWVDYFVYYGISVVFDVADVGEIRDINSVSLRLV